MGMFEAHFGVEITMIALNEETKRKALELRNNYVTKRGEPYWTISDVFEKSINTLYEIEKMEQLARAAKERENAEKNTDRSRPGAFAEQRNVQLPGREVPYKQEHKTEPKAGG